MYVKPFKLQVTGFELRVKKQNSKKDTRCEFIQSTGHPVCQSANQCSGCELRNIILCSGEKSQAKQVTGFELRVSG